MAPVTLINPFEVPPAREVEFLAAWKEANGTLREQPGFVSSELHRSCDENARFRFTSITTWQSGEDFRAAILHPDFVKCMDRMSFPHYAALYDLFLHDDGRHPRRPGLAPAPAEPRSAGAPAPNPLH